jgi:hypothetical protein
MFINSLQKETIDIFVFGVQIFLHFTSHTLFLFSKNKIIF